MNMKKKAIVTIATLALCAMAVSCSKENRTAALMKAVKNNDAFKVRWLIRASADVNTKDDEGKTALMYAATNNATDVAKLLIQAGADVNAQDHFDCTALM